MPSGGTMPPGSLREVPQVASRYLSSPRVRPTLAFELRTYGFRRFTSPCLRGPAGSSKRKNAKKVNGFGHAPPHGSCYVSEPSGCFLVFFMLKEKTLPSLIRLGTIPPST